MELRPAIIGLGDDKQELETRRLQLEESSPANELTPTDELVPTAPAIEEVNEAYREGFHDFHDSQHEPEEREDVESLPRYGK